jgi:hypothetical protein
VRIEGWVQQTLHPSHIYAAVLGKRMVSIDGHGE